MSDYGDEFAGRLMGSAEGVAQRLLTGAFRAVSRKAFDGLKAAWTAAVREVSAPARGGDADEAWAREEDGRRRAHAAQSRADEDWVVAMSYADGAAAEAVDGAPQAQAPVAPSDGERPREAVPQRQADEAGAAGPSGEGRARPAAAADDGGAWKADEAWAREEDGRRRAHAAQSRADEDWVVAMSYADRAAAAEAVEVLAAHGVDAVVGAEGPDGTCDVVAEVSPRAAAALGASVAKADAEAHAGEFEADLARARGLHAAAAASAGAAATGDAQRGPVLRGPGA